MVCQEEVFSWFKDLSGYKRLDVMCGLLNMCLPFELRFFGTCVEDLGKKDFHYLREAENRANNTAELSKLTNLTEDVTRSKLIISLALLESSNHVCSNVIFNILTEEAKISKLPNSDKIIDELLLLFTMALYHPAFTFDQKTLVGNQLNDIRRLLSEIPPKDKNNPYSVKDIPVTTEPLNFKHASIYSRVSQSGANDLNGTYIKDIQLKRYHRRRADKRGEFRLQVTWFNCETSEILKTYQELHEFSQRVADVCRSDSKLKSKENNIPSLPAVLKPGSKLDDNSDELAARVTEFVQCLPKVLPELMGCDWVVAFFQGQSVQQTPSQWPRILPTSPTNPSSSQGLALSSVGMPMQQNTNGPNQRLPKDDISTEVGRMKSLTIYNSQIDHSGKVVQDARRGNLQMGLRDTGSNKSTRYSAPPVYTASCSSPLTSPQSSPIPSPFTSPPQSVASSRATSPWVPRNEMTAEFKQIFTQDKLGQFKLKLKNFTFEELSSMSDEDLMKLGIQSDGISDIRKTIDIVRSHPLNGLNIRSSTSSAEESSGSTLLNPSPVPPIVGLPPQSPPVTNPSDMPPAVVFISPADSQSLARVNGNQAGQVYTMGSSNTASAPAAVMNMANFVPYPTTVVIPQLSQTRNVLSQYNLQTQQQMVVSNESSPTCSEYSSPPGSPSLELRNNYDSSCSEEIDKDSDIVKKSSESSCRQEIIGDRRNLTLKLHDDDVVIPAGSTSSRHTNSSSSSSSSISTRRGVMPDIVPISSASSSTTGTNTAVFPRSRVPATSQSPPGQGFKYTPQQQQQQQQPQQQQQQQLQQQTIQMVSPGRNSSSGSIVFENSQMMKSVPTAVVPPTPPTLQGRWDNGSNFAASTVFANTIVSPSVVTCTPRHVVVTTASRSHAKNVYAEEGHKMNSMSSSMSLQHAPCIPCMSHIGEVHSLSPYPNTPITYPNMPPSPGATATAAVCTTPAFHPGTNCPSSLVSQTQMSHTHAAVLPPTSTGCLNSCGCSCNHATPNANLPYAHNFLATFPINNANAPAMYHPFPPYVQTHNTNSFMASTGLPPNFHFGGNHLSAAPPPPIPNGINPELVYSGSQFSMMQQQNGSQHSTRLPTPGFIPGHNPNVTFHATYANPSGQQQQPHLAPKSKPVSCYNCGVVGHRGLECKEATMEEITKPGQFRLNYAPASRPTEGGGE